ncbi:MAG: methyltransferase domain-containing protein [Planctomycetes bacterium]|nr:methyltransferase domain-containing protein [Planctomycetota bacterium]
MTSYLMEDAREAARLVGKVEAPEWIRNYCTAWLDGPQQILDLGAGPGVLAQALAAFFPGARIVATDLQVRRFDPELPGRIHANAARAEELPFADGSFDAVFSRLLFQFLPDPAACMREIARVLRPGGRALVQDLDGQLVWHDGMDPELEHDCEVVRAALVATGFDPFVGRRLRRLGIAAGLVCDRVLVQPYHLIAGTISRVEDALWLQKLQIAAPRIAAALGSPAAGESFIDRYMAHLRSPATLTYSMLFSCYLRVTDG